jgi:hypothetical protein
MIRCLTIATFLCAALAEEARACARPQLDAQAVQWSSQILEAKLVGVSERVEMRALAVKPPPGGKEEISAVYWLRVYSFEVERVIDSDKNSVKPKHRVEVVRFFGRVDDPNAPKDGPKPAAAAATRPTDPCLEHLTRANVGKSFVLLLRPERDIKMKMPPVWADPRRPDPRDDNVHLMNAYAVIHLIPKAAAPEPEITKLRRLVAETRSAERKVPDAEVKKQIDVILKAETDAAAEPAIAALKRVGFRVVPAIKAARDRRDTRAAAKERLAKLAIEMSPPPLEVLMGEHVE